MPFGVVQQLFERRMAELDGDRRERVLEGAAGNALVVLGGTGRAGDGRPADTSAVLHGLYWLTVGLAELAPLVIAVDDAQWADEESLSWLAYLVRRLEGLSVLLVVAAREGEPLSASLGALRSERAAVRLRARPLSDKAVRRLLEQAFSGHQVDEAFAARCHEVTGGNPLLVVEVVRELQARGLAPGESVADLLETLASEGLRDMVLVRLERLSADARRVAEAVAILGQAADAHRAGEIAGLAPARCLSAVDELVQAHLLGSLRPLCFVHPLMRTAVYRTLPDGARSLLHGRAARVLAGAGAPLAQVAAQLLAAEPLGDGWRVAVLRRAAGQARATGAVEAAARYLARALAEPPLGEDRVGVLHELGRAEMALGRGEAIAHLEAALAAADRPQRRAEIALDFSEAVRVTPRQPEGMQTIDRLIAQLGPGDEELRLLLEAEALNHARWLNITDLEARLRRLPRDLEGRTRGERQLLVAILSAELPIGQAKAARVLDCARRLQPIDDWLEDQPDVATAALLSGCLMVAGAFTEAEAGMRSAQEVCRRSGWQDAYVECCVQLALVLTAGRGALGEAEVEAWSGYEAVASLGPGPLREPAGALSALAVILLERGRLREARRLLDEAPAATGGVGRRLAEVRGRLTLAEGDLAGGIQQLSALEPGPDNYNWRLDLAVALAQAGRQDDGRRIVADKLDRARRFGSPVAEARALRAQGLVEGGSAGVDALQQAVRLLEGSGAAHSEAQALIDLGRVLRQTRRSREARPLLYRGLELARHCGADALAAFAETELRATGARPRRGARPTGANALTASERRVADLAAEGMTNRQIAQSLFVTMKTVEKHLASAYAKLGIASRQELGSALSASRRDNG